MNIKNAVVAEIEPYTTSINVVEKAILDCGLEGNNYYVPVEHKKSVAKAAVLVLQKMLALTNTSFSGQSQSYSTEELKKRINALAAENNIELAAEELGEPVVEIRQIPW